MGDSVGRRSRIVGLTLAVVIALAAAVLIDGEVDVPGWANVPGVDLPFVGDDPLNCDVVAVDATTVRVELSGADDVIDDFVHVHVNGEPSPESEMVGHVAIVSLPADRADVHLSVATEPGAVERFWCGSANSNGVIER